jgi:hypothetical protein
VRISTWPHPRPQRGLFNNFLWTCSLFITFIASERLFSISVESDIDGANESLAFYPRYVNISLLFDVSHGPDFGGAVHAGRPRSSNQSQSPSLSSESDGQHPSGSLISTCMRFANYDLVTLRDWICFARLFACASVICLDPNVGFGQHDGEISFRRLGIFLFIA